jgi:hypothetical protein
MNEILTYITTYREGLSRAAGDGPVEPNFARIPNVAPTLAGIPRDARFVAVEGRAGDLTQLLEFHQLEGLWIGHAGADELEFISTLRGLQGLVVWQLTAQAVDPLASLLALRHLVLPMASKVRALTPLASLTQLEALHLGELRYVTDLSPLGGLTGLCDLVLFGGLYSKLQVASLAPLSNLQRLEYLFVASLRVKDNALSPIAKLRHLRYMSMPNVFPVEQCAAVAGALPNARGHILKPLFSETALRGVRVCRKCQGDLVMTTGKPLKVLCPACDRLKLERHLARWKALVEKAAA